MNDDLYRFFELLLAFVLAILSFPFLVIIAVIIAIDSPGNPILVQQRVGRHKRPFKLYKLRTMRRGTVAAGTHEVSAAQVTRVGAFLRRVKLDELPQVWNVLLNNMRFVGPRPCLPTQNAVIDARDALGVYTLHPGITGLAQVANIDMSTPEKLAEADAEYMRTRTAKGDLDLLWRTFLGGGRGDRVKG